MQREARRQRRWPSILGASGVSLRRFLRSRVCIFYPSTLFFILSCTQERDGSAARVNETEKRNCVEARKRLTTSLPG